MPPKDKKYVLACDFELMKAEDILAEKDLDANPLLRQEYAIFDLLYKRPYLINESIYQFLLFFKEPQTFETALHSFHYTDDMEADSEAHLFNFFSGLVKKSFLVSPESNEKIAKEVDKENNLPEVSVDGYETIKIFKQIYNLWVALVKKNQGEELVVIKKLIYTEDDKEVLNEKQEFLQEFTILKEIDTYPSICKLLFLDEKNYVAGLEYIEGETLRSFIKKQNPDLKTKITLINSLLETFAYLHQKGIVHGDIHASNFMVDKNKNLKVIDFGLSNHLELKEKEILKRGAAHCYVPPERVSTNPFKIINKQKTDCSSENYQLGIIMYFILYGKIPFDALTWKILSKEIIEKPVDFELQTPSKERIPDELISVLKRTLQKMPKNRYQTAIELKADWEKQLHNTSMAYGIEN